MPQRDGQFLKAINTNNSGHNDHNYTAPLNSETSFRISPILLRWLRAQRARQETAAAARIK